MASSKCQKAQGQRLSAASLGTELGNNGSRMPGESTYHNVVGSGQQARGWARQTRQGVHAR